MLAGELCSGCGACYSICPRGAITMKPNKEGFLSPDLDEKKCCNCQKCTHVCPVLNKSKGSVDLGYFAVINKDQITRSESSSGGLFTAISEEIIDENGRVFGVALEKQSLTAKHVVANTQDGIAPLRGSKYVQSEIGDSFVRCKEYLTQGEKVLFTGTPCQIAGLKCFLGRDYSNLFTLDFICHGVPSPLAWKTYVKYVENVTGQSIEKVSFRNKTRGWRKYSLYCELSDGQTYSHVTSEDYYLKSFFENLFLRNSCYDCPFKKGNIFSDITMADFWGIEKVLNHVDDDKGASLAIVHTEKGKDLLKSLNRKVEVFNVSESDAVRGNKGYIVSSKPNLWRSRAFRQISSMDFDTVIEKYCGLSLLSKVRRKISKVYYRIR